MGKFDGMTERNIKLYNIDYKNSLYKNVFSKEEKLLVLDFDKNQQTWETVGWGGNRWKLLGVAENSNWQAQATELWQWLNGQYQTITKEALDNGKAYWAK